MGSPTPAKTTQGGLTTYRAYAWLCGWSKRQDVVAELVGSRPLVHDPRSRDSRGRLKASEVARLDRQAAAEGKLIDRRQTEHTPAGRSTADLTDQEYANSEASMVVCATLQR